MGLMNLYIALLCFRIFFAFDRESCSLGRNISSSSGLLSHSINRKVPCTLDNKINRKINIAHVPELWEEAVQDCHP